MAHNLPALQQKAVSLRDYLQQDNIKDTLQSALPKWMSSDRLLRIVFTTAMKNPKIMECSKESILSSVMQCAQLGLEPILGRAYLIPYNNKKYVDGKVVKVLECQFQPGYQGLVDLARRSNTIADVWGFNVYEADDFKLEYGNNPNIEHVPWHVDPIKRKEKNPGEIIGAYVVWQLKDGTKHIEFMPIHDIHKRRAKSQAYQWSETGDPKRGGGKRDSIWHEWPEEQNLKTVIKHSSKLVPSSIEFMQAVELDDAADIGRSQLGMFTDSPNFEGLLPDSASTIDVDSLPSETQDSGTEPPPPTEPEKPVTDPRFAKLIKDQTGQDFEFVPTAKDGTANDMLSAFIELSADHQAEKITPYQMMTAIAENPGSFPGFWNGFQNGTWKQHFKGKLPEVETEQSEPESEEEVIGEKETSEPEDDIQERFETFLVKNIDKAIWPKVGDYLEEQAKLGQVTIDDVMVWAISNVDDFKNGFNMFLKRDAKKQTEPAPSDWDPYTSNIMGRYAKEKAEVLKQEAKKWNISIKGKLPKDVHAEILAAKKKAAAAAEESQPEQENDPEFEDDNPFDDDDNTEFENSEQDPPANIDYRKELERLAREDKEGLIAACSEVGYGDEVVIPLSEAPQKKLYEVYLKLKG